MDPARWERIKELCYAALDHPAEDRATFVAGACRGDEELRLEAVSLLEQFAADPDYLETPLIQPPHNVPEAMDASAAGTTIGPYRVIRPLGQGGMGDVYLAVDEQKDFRRSVALKVIRRGLDTDDVLQRFRQERQILASLHHPNIAALLDGGVTDDGRPYFVMEYIEGVPIDRFCDERRLSVRQRIELFQVICFAVSHAHRNLVVHRDLKPRNTLVTDEGTPKLLDFGIGKVLAPGRALSPAVQTKTDARLLTPEYAAPEQVKGEPVTTATDVYGLGILLYELLTGHHPYSTGRETLAELEQAVREAQPRRPSAMVTRTTDADYRADDGAPASITPNDIAAARATEPGRLRRRLAGDLDNIVLMALRKEPERRYASAAALADDLDRYVQGQPVRARADTWRYRTTKFVRRNAWAATAAAVALFALATTTVVTLIQSQRVASERDNALAERDKALEVRGFLMEMFGATSPDRATGDSVTARQLLDLQAARIDQAYPDEPELRAEMMDVLADGYDRLGLYPEAAPLARRALDLRRATLEPGHPDIGASLNMLGWIYHERGMGDSAVPLLREAVTIRRAAGDRLILSRSLNDLGVALQAMGEYNDAQDILLEAFEIRSTELGRLHRSVGITANNLAASFFFTGAYDRAVEYAEHAVAALRASVGLDHQRTSIALGNLGYFESLTGDKVAAEEALRAALARQTRRQGPTHRATITLMQQLGMNLRQQGRLDDAEPFLRDAVESFERHVGDEHPDVAYALGALAAWHADRREFDRAIELTSRALAIHRRALGDEHRSVGTTIGVLGRYHRDAGRPDRAAPLMAEAVEILETALGSQHPTTASYRVVLAHSLLSQDRPSDALRAYTQSHDAMARRTAERLISGLGTLVNARLGMAEANMALGRIDAADSLLAESRRALLGDSSVLDDPELDGPRRTLARLEREFAQIERSR